MAPADLNLGAFLKDAFHFQTHMDNRVISTIGTLLRRPGELTSAWIKGRRRDFAKPIQLFVVLNLVFFLIAPRIGILLFTITKWTPGKGLPGVSAEAMLRKQAELGYTPEQMVTALNRALDPQKKWFFLIWIPMLTAALWLLHPRRRVVEHLVFAIHQACVLFVYMLGLGLCVRLCMAREIPERIPRALAAGVALALLVTMAAALRRVYQRGWIVTSLGAMLTVGTLVPAAIVSQRLAFILAFGTL
ncbi:MAG: DUF3667 domain-containing protein [Acidobacteria bacterium]|nr:DUF3667 domain-containing protein [Acidobacteriota bacterium]